MRKTVKNLFISSTITFISLTSYHLQLYVPLHGTNTSCSKVGSLRLHRSGRNTFPAVMISNEWVNHTSQWIPQPIIELHWLSPRKQVKQSNQQEDLLPDNTLATFLCLAFLLSLLPQSLLSQTQTSRSHGFMRHAAYVS